MKIVIIGGSGLIGQKLKALLQEAGHEVVSASPSSGVNAVTGEGLTQALAGAQVVVDVTNSPSFEDEAVMQFFTASTRNLLRAEAIAGVRHHVALSVVGSERAPDGGYLRAKVAQEALIKAGPVPYTILRATQFFEFAASIAYVSTVGQAVRVTSAKLQPVAATDVVETLADIAVRPALNGTCEVAGPEAIPLNDWVSRALQANHDPREVVRDDEARYFGSRLNDQTLTAGPGARIGRISLQDWLEQQGAAR
ncbi:SDR family oxidoreductase [Chitinimonas naiadis]